jgi:hypothetical protein
LFVGFFALTCNFFVTFFKARGYGVCKGSWGVVTFLTFFVTFLQSPKLWAGAGLLTFFVTFF